MQRFPPRLSQLPPSSSEVNVKAKFLCIEDAVQIEMDDGNHRYVMTLLRLDTDYV